MLSGYQSTDQSEMQSLKLALQRRGGTALVLCTLPALSAFFADGFGGLLGPFPCLLSDLTQVHIMVRLFLLWAFVVASIMREPQATPLIETFNGCWKTKQTSTE